MGVVRSSLRIRLRRHPTPTLTLTLQGEGTFLLVLNDWLQICLAPPTFKTMHPAVS